MALHNPYVVRSIFNSNIQYSKNFSEYYWFFLNQLVPTIPRTNSALGTATKMLVIVFAVS